MWVKYLWISFHRLVFLSHSQPHQNQTKPSWSKKKTQPQKKLSKKRNKVYKKVVINYGISEISWNKLIYGLSQLYSKQIFSGGFFLQPWNVPEPAYIASRRMWGYWGRWVRKLNNNILHLCLLSLSTKINR